MLEDMLSDSPRYPSISQQRPEEYWEKVDPIRPEYLGPEHLPLAVLSGDMISYFCFHFISTSFSCNKIIL